MDNLFDRLNLSSGERRLVVVVFIVFFVTINVWIVWPYLNENHTRINNDLEKSQITLMNYEKEIEQQPDRDSTLNELKAKMAEGKDEEIESYFLSDAAFEYRRKIQTAAKLSGIMSPNIQFSKARSTGEESYYVERPATFTTTTEHSNLLKFLLNMSSADPRIRIQDLLLLPDRKIENLKCTITLVANFEKEEEEEPIKPAPARKQRNTRP
ncbi:MAG TPA: hypothetical protein EYQ50_05420 [Verrucomicrobiales bacterium]|nr:hypothetical protein [Verrucomicrobiales bacterium]